MAGETACPTTRRHDIGRGRTTPESEAGRLARGFAGFDESGALSEGVPIHSADIGREHQVRFATPEVFGSSLQNLEAAVNDLKYIAGLDLRTGGRKVNRNHAVRPELAGQGGRDFHTHRAIHEELPAIADGLKQSGIGATGANGVEHDATFGKGHGVAGKQVGGHYSQRGAHLLKPVGLQEPLQESLHALATDHAQAAETPSPDIAEAHRAAGAGDLLGSSAAGVRGGDDGPSANAGDVVDGDPILLEDAEHAGMSDAAGEAAAQRQTNTDRRRRVGCGVFFSRPP